MSRKRSLSSVVAATLVTVTTLLLGCTSLLRYRDESESQTRQLQGLARLQVRQACVALALPLWNLDHDQVEKVVEAIAQPKSVYAFRVVTTERTYGRVRDASWKLVPWTTQSLPADLWVYEAPVTFSGKEVGHIRLLVTQRFLNDDLSKLRIRLLLMVLFVDVLLVASVYFILSRMVLKPVSAIERNAAAVSAGGKPDGPAQPMTTRELANLQESIDTMVRLLDRRYVELQEEMARRSESEDRFLTIVESVNDAIMLRDPKSGAILDVNERACEMFGYSRAEMRAFGSEVLSSGEEPYTPEHVMELFRQLRPGGSFLMEWCARHRDGHRFWVEVNARLAEIGGEPQVIVVVRDITARKEMEEALRLGERMSMIGALVAGVAHEVRNPLFGISATLEAFAAEFGTTEATAEYMTTLHKDVARLTRLMNELLEYGRPHPLVRNVQALEPVIDEALRVCAPRAKEKQIVIRPQVAEPLPPVAIDAERMLLVLKNVVENAIEFSGFGSSVTLDAHAEWNGASALICSIADHGPGFREEDLPHVFDPFFTRRRGGSGLGLAIVQKIVTDHGGRVAAENLPDGGARVEIRLPV